MCSCFMGKGLNLILASAICFMKTQPTFIYQPIHNVSVKFAILKCIS